MRAVSKFTLALRLSIGVILLAMARYACADSESGYFQVMVVGSSNTDVAYSSNSVNSFAVVNKTLPAQGTGTTRCFLNGVITPLNSTGNQAIYSMLLAANLAGKAVTIYYTYNSSLPGYCQLDYVNIN